MNTVDLNPAQTFSYCWHVEYAKSNIVTRTIKSAASALKAFIWQHTVFITPETVNQLRSEFPNALFVKALPGFTVRKTSANNFINSPKQHHSHFPDNNQDGLINHLFGTKHQDNLDLLSNKKTPLEEKRIAPFEKNQTTPDYKNNSGHLNTGTEGFGLIYKNKMVRVNIKRLVSNVGQYLKSYQTSNEFLETTKSKIINLAKSFQQQGITEGLLWLSYKKVDVSNRIIGSHRMELSAWKLEPCRAVNFKS